MEIGSALLPPAIAEKTAAGFADRLDVDSGRPNLGPVCASKVVLGLNRQTNFDGDVSEIGTTGARSSNVVDPPRFRN